jgi:hypothetical protein
MFDFPKKERVFALIQEAIESVSHLGKRQTTALEPELTKALQTLETSASARHHQALILAAVRRHISQAEKQVVAQLIGDEPIYSDEMPDLVRIRVICAELVAVLTYSLEQLKASPAGA